MSGTSAIVARLRAGFVDATGEEPTLVRAPGRVNLIGDHTDYNDGFVLPVAIQFETWAAICARPDRQVRVRSVTLSSEVQFDLGDEDPVRARNWSDYVRGVAVALERKDLSLRGMDLFVDSSIPLGSGLSSSAALEVSTGFAMLHVSGHEVDLDALVDACHWADNSFVGVRSGIMDQYASSHAEEGSALLLDCRSRASSAVPLPDRCRFVVADTMTRHSLATGDYNHRRQECEQAVALLAARLDGVRALRDVSEAAFEAHAEALPPVIRRRCRHVVSENARVLAAADALRSGDVVGFGRLMTASHESLRDDFEVSSRELDLLVEIACSLEGVYGARMTGGGFGGCTISLVDDATLAAFHREVAAVYEHETGTVPDIFEVEASAGVSLGPNSGVDRVTDAL